VKGFPQGRDEALANPKLGSGCELLRLQTCQGTKIIAEFASALDDQGRPVANLEGNCRFGALESVNDID